MRYQARTYRKRPVEVEAVKWTMDNWQEVCDFMGIDHDSFRVELSLDTLEGTMRAEAGSYIIRGVKGELYPCRGDIFEETYEAVT